MTDKPGSKLNEAVAALQRQERLPERDLWPGIAHALLQPPQEPWYRHAALAAAILVVLALSLYFGARQPATVTPDPRFEAFIAALQSEHEASKQALLVQYENQVSVYPEWSRQMEQLEDAEVAIYRALRDDPTNLELLGILRQVQARQIELIDAVFDPRFSTI